MSEPKSLKHIAIICDGNRRWARAHKMEAFKGHEKAVNDVFEPLIDRAIEREMTHLTFWVFSTENWDRDKKEVEGLMNLFRGFFDRQVQELHKKGVRVNMIGNISHFAQDIQDRIIKGMEETKDNKEITVTLAMSYGGRDEITRAVKKIAQKVKDGEMSVEAIDQDVITASLDTADMPDPDLVVRTSGELRLSGYLPWQSVYAEFWFPEFPFPEFTPARLDEAIEIFQKRQRRFGK